jgi:hypothetical protein
VLSSCVDTIPSWSPLPGAAGLSDHCWRQRGAAQGWRGAFPPGDAGMHGSASARQPLPLHQGRQQLHRVVDGRRPRGGDGLGPVARRFRPLRRPSSGGFGLPKLVDACRPSFRSGVWHRVGRNDPCPCDTGKNSKRGCGRAWGGGIFLEEIGRLLVATGAAGPSAVAPQRCGHSRHPHARRRGGGAVRSPR